MGYANPNVIVEAEWLAANMDNPDIKIIEVDYNPDTAYRIGHIPGGIMMWWKHDINDAFNREIIHQDQFERLMCRKGINYGDTLVLYGDYNNWFAAFALWVFKMYAHPDVRILNGGRKKWEAENREYTTDIPNIKPTKYAAGKPNMSFRSYRINVEDAIDNPNYKLLDTRNPEEYQGKAVTPPEFPDEKAQRPGHIPGAVNVTWNEVLNKDGTFKSAEDLQKMYESAGITPDKEIITYCRIGERSAHTWMVLKYLLGYEHVSSYDGSWSEWGNSIGVPIVNRSAMDSKA